jgi:hypothetical protein
MGKENEADVVVVNALAGFLLDIMERLPADLEIQTNTLRQAVEMFDTHLARAKRQHKAEGATLDRLSEIVDYFKKAAYGFGDTAMLSTVLRPLLHKMKELAAEGLLDVGFSDEEWSNGIDGR